MIKFAPIAHASLGFSGYFGFSYYAAFTSSNGPYLTFRLPNRFPPASWEEVGWAAEFILRLPKSPPPALDELFYYYMGKPPAEDDPIKLNPLYYGCEGALGCLNTGYGKPAPG